MSKLSIRILFLINQQYKLLQNYLLILSCEYHKIYLCYMLQILYYILVVAFIVPLIIMIVAYIKVGVSLHQSVKEVKAMTSDTNR